MTSRDVDTDRFPILLDAALGTAEVVEADFSAPEGEEVARLRAVLEAVDAAWQAPPPARERVRAIFLRRLAARRPDHPWLRSDALRQAGAPAPPRMWQGREENYPAAGAAPSAQRARQATWGLLARVPAHEPVLLHGRHAEGRELVARYIHNSSPRRGGPFVAINCASFDEALLASELFGYAKGALAYAVTERRGRVELAHKGAIFLDEIDATSFTIQKKLLRLLQEQEVERLGASSPIRVDVRVIAATSRDLSQEVANGRFRADLHQRLSVNTFAV